MWLLFDKQTELGELLDNCIPCVKPLLSLEHWARILIECAILIQDIDEFEIVSLA